MACGKLALTSISGFETTMEQETPFLLFQAGDPSDLASKLANLLKLSRKSVEDMGHYLRRQTVQNHSLGKLAENLTTLLHKLKD